MVGEIKNLAVGLPKNVYYNNDQHVMRSAICKQSTEMVYLRKEGFEGDGVADLKHHGGPERAVCLYPYEHYSYWENEFHKQLEPATFGENVTVSNMIEKDVYIGNIYRIGEATVQVTQGRVPCNTISNRAEIPLLLKRIMETGYTGYFCKVLEEGTIEQTSTITLLDEDPKKVSVLFANQTFFHNKKDIPAIHKILEVDALAGEWKERLEKLI